MITFQAVGKRVPLRRLYELTSDALRLADKEISSYLPSAEKIRLESLITNIEAGIETYKPKSDGHDYRKMLTAIFMPGRATKFYPHERKDVPIVTAPERWEEPYVKHFLRQFMSLITDNNRAFFHDGHTTDEVYAGIVINEKKKGKIEKRRMSKYEYGHWLRSLRSADTAELNMHYKPAGIWQRTPAIEVTTYEEFQRIFEEKYGQGIAGPKTTALQVIDKPQKPAVAKKPQPPVRTEALVKKELDAMSNARLAMESGFTPRTVKKHRERGVDGLAVVDEKYAMTERQTSAALVHRLRQSGVPEDAWADLIDEARNWGISVKILTDVVKQIGVDNPEEILGAMEEMSSEVLRYAERMQITSNEAMRLAMQTYIEQGGNTDRAVDVLWQRYPEYVSDYEGETHRELRSAEKIRQLENPSVFDLTARKKRTIW